ncbi:MAG: hypothetical protein O2887_04625 [Bacteroidetes bacterium]|nr:hypothetical protein [Bacteroidota bacterium]MDA1119768.1 hypothetical protein [Bacteroidota bacterium]
MNLVKGFLKFLGGEEGEDKAMLLLLGQGFFMGVFIATYQVGAETLFISELGDELLSESFFAAGIMGVITTVIFVWFQRFIRFSILAISTSFIILVFVVGLRIAYFTIPWPYWSFVQFVMIGPASVLIILSFWGIFGRMFNLRQSKRIIGGIDTGQLSATVIAFFSIPIISSVLDSDTHDLLIAATISCFGVFFFTIWIVRVFNLDAATKVKHGEEKANTVNFLTLFKDKYLRMMCLFLAFSMAAGTFVEYTFYTAT